MNLSFWERNTFFDQFDTVIIGSGIVGLNAALTLREKQPHWKIAILEKGTLPSGGSTKNAGFACFGSPSELLDDLTQTSESQVFSLVEQRWRGLQRLRQRLGDTEIGFEPLSGYEVFRTSDEALFRTCQDALPYLNDELRRIIPLAENYKTADARLTDFGFQGFEHLIQIAAEGQIDTGKMMQKLLQLAQNQGVMIFNGVAITYLEDEKNHVRLETTQGWEIRTQRVIVATNGFTRHLLPHLNVTPARNQVLITLPIPHLRLQGTFHLDKGYYYFRNVGERVLLGGGRNLDLQGEATDIFGTTPLIRECLYNLLTTNVLPYHHFEIDAWWSGILGVGDQKRPIIEKVSENIVVAVRMGGMGVAIGSLVGEEGALLALV